ncbi:MAG: GNAT family N-acetyltransferase [Ginsengibacter sp.]
MLHKDNEALAIIIRRSLEEFNANKPGTVYYDTSTDTMSENFTEKNSAYFVLEEDGQLAGGCGFYPTEGLPNDTCELVKMYLASKYRKKGYGQLLLDRCIAEAKLAGYSKMYIETLPELKNAIELYKKNGFNFIDKPLGNSGHTGCDIWMMKKI